MITLKAPKEIKESIYGIFCGSNDEDTNSDFENIRAWVIFPYSGSFAPAA